MIRLSVDSEIGRLHEAIIHRTRLELARLTPQNIGALLFDDIVWAAKAKEEHDAFAQALRDKGGPRPLLRRTTGPDTGSRGGRDFVLDRLCTPELLGASLAVSVRRLFDDLEAVDVPVIVARGA